MYPCNASISTLVRLRMFLRLVEADPLQRRIPHTFQLSVSRMFLSGKLIKVDTASYLEEQGFPIHPPVACTIPLTNHE